MFRAISKLSPRRSVAIFEIPRRSEFSARFSALTARRKPNFSSPTSKFRGTNFKKLISRNGKKAVVRREGGGGRKKRKVGKLRRARRAPPGGVPASDRGFTGWPVARRPDACREGGPSPAEDGVPASSVRQCVCDMAARRYGHLDALHLAM